MRHDFRSCGTRCSSRTCATPAGGFLFALGFAVALPERISYTVGNALMRLNSFSLRLREGRRLAAFRD